MESINRLRHDDAPLPSHEEFRNLRATALNRLLQAGIVFGILWYAHIGLVQESINLERWLGPLLLVGGSLLAGQQLGRDRYRTATAVYLIAVVSAILLETWSSRNGATLMLLTLPAGMTGLLLGTTSSMIFAAFASLTTLTWPATAAWLAALTASAATPATTPSLDAAAAWLVVVTLWLTALLLWVAVHPLRITTHWAWASYEQARVKMEQTREHRAHLAGVLKELDAANQRLKLMTNELERARRAAVEARRLKAEFAANISHELRTPLNLIIGFTEMMTLAPETYGEALPIAYRSDLQTVYRNARHLSMLVDDVLDLSQVEAGRMGLVRVPLAIGEVIQEAVEVVAPLYRQKRLALTTTLPPDLPPVEADRTRIRQVLINLLYNAARFTEQGGVTVTASSGPQEVTVEVADTGRGIETELLPGLFEEFSQVNQRSRGQAGGSGLGLAVCKRFVELHGGHIGAQSALESGTTIAFSLPQRADLGISWQPPAWETWALVGGDNRRRPTVVVVADTPAATGTVDRLFARYLEDFDVAVVASTEEARRFAARELIYALIHVTPSGEAGWIDLRKAREGLPNVPMLVCTLRSSRETEPPPGATLFLAKPVTRERFLGVLENLPSQLQRLLIVDDEPEVVRLLSRMALSAERPFSVRRAYSGRQALELLVADPPDALILDLLMPEVNGYRVIEQVRQEPRFADLPIIVVGARGIEEAEITAGLVGMTKREGFSVGEVMRLLKANLDTLRPAPLLYTERGSGAKPAVKPALQ